MAMVTLPEIFRSAFKSSMPADTDIFPATEAREFKEAVPAVLFIIRLLYATPATACNAVPLYCTVMHKIKNLFTFSSLLRFKTYK